MSEQLTFVTREEFREWLSKNHTSTDGFWILFQKSKNVPSIKASEALEEALCYGWIDGLMKRLDEETYIKYFSARRKNSKWSSKNKEIVERLENEGRMTAFGRAKVEEAKKNGQWHASNKESNELQEQMETLLKVLKAYDVAYTNFQAMSPSVQKTYCRAYFDAKTKEGRKKRLEWMLHRIEQNLKPM